MRWLIALAAALLAASPAHAEERITRFASDIAIQPDGDLLVTEEIRVRSEGDRIQRGIFRDFPTRYRGRAGSAVRVGFTLIETRRDGQTEPSKVEAIGNGVRIRIGSPDVLLDPGIHDYVIRYRTTRQLGRFADYDELYWNVTGNGWDFPIDAAEARIALPSPAAFGRRAIYTGPQGATGSAGEVVEEQPGTILFRSTAPLAPREGMTVAVAWPKGVIAEPTQESRLFQWLADYGPPLAGAFGLVGLLFYYFFAWKRVGRGPLAGTVVPIFAPPDDLTPAAMRYVWKMKADNRSFAAALVDLGVRGHVRLAEEDGGWLAKDKTRIDRLASADPLPVAEEAMLRELATTGQSIVMDNDNHAKFSTARSALGEHLKDNYEGRLFLRNWSWSLVGLALFVTALWLVALALLVAEGGDASGMAAVGAVAGAVALLCFLAGLRARTGGRCLLTGIAGVAAIVAGALTLPMLPQALASGRFVPLLLPLLALPFVLSAFSWMAAPTKEGRGVLDRIAGFRLYLSIAEGPRLNRMTAPAETLATFEKYLPYAIALGVENRWARRFEGMLAAAAAQGQAQGFAWYSGSHSPWNDSSGFVDQVGSSLSSAISSAATAPGSSSGSGGGGSSGGGGGGGGGGGW